MCVTFVMPFRNCVTSIPESVWRKCIECIISQTYQDWTCIAVNDMSQDNSASILSSYNDSRFKIVNNHSNMGLTKSLNLAISMVKTPYIARHDSDDFSSSTRLETQIKFMNDNKNICVVGSFAKVFDLSLTECDRQIRPTSHKNIRIAIRRSNPMVHGSVLMRTKDIKEVGGYNESFYVCQDYELWSRMLLAGKIMHNIPQYLYNRVSHKASTSKMNSHLRKKAVRKIRAMHS